MKPIYVLATILCSMTLYGQNPMIIKFNNVSDAALRMNVYEKDLSAHAVVLEEYGDYYFEFIDSRMYLMKHFFAKIKILDKQGVQEANIKIPFHRKEELLHIKAITHNLDSKDELDLEKIYVVNTSSIRSEKRFTFPNVKAGSILEYQYTLKTPFFYNFDGWYFQSHLPKIYSEFRAKILSNYRYNRFLKGNQRLDINTSTIKKKCFSIPGNRIKADCELVKYAMRDIPAFREEPYMISKNNYISKLVFELSEFKRFERGKDVFTKTWDDVDKLMRKDEGIGKQLRKKGFFKNKLPEEILAETSLRVKAQKIYEFVRDHYTWNGQNRLFYNANVKKAFKEGIGNSTEINLSLIDCYLAAKIPVETVFLSTRNRGMPRLDAPVMSDFNYVIAKITINEEVFLLDATEKELPFGMLPIRALNNVGRAMDFKQPSYWGAINPYGENEQNTFISLKINSDGNTEGRITQKSTGYLAYKKRSKQSESATNALLKAIEKDVLLFEIDDYKTEDVAIVESPFQEEFQLVFDEDAFTDTETFFNPFFIKVFSKNPFQADTRQFPIDFAYPRTYTTRVSMSIPENYEFTTIPETQAFIIPGKKASCGVKILQKGGQLNMIFQLKLTSFYFETAEYQEVKKFFTQLSILQENLRITIKKK
ncbi:MAG: DUF3857 domain-containing protein [Bacteroidota bacterium]